MSLSTPARIAVPFAVSGLKATIPANSDNTTGRAGYDQGFPPINMQLKTVGGIPPYGQDMNGILYDNSVVLQYLQAGGGYPYNSTFATAIGGYTVGACVMRSDGAGFWINNTNNNTTDPDAGGAGWEPGFTAGAAAITMTSSNVTLTASQYGRPVIVIAGALTANLNLIFPNIVGRWVIINNATGNFTVTCKTSAGSGVAAYIGNTMSIVGDATNIYIADSAYSIGFGQSWQNVTGSRALGTTYTNTTGRTIVLNTNITIAGGSFPVSTCLINGTITLAGSAVASSGTASIGNFTVPPGATYQLGVSAGTGTIVLWNELRS